VKPDKRRYRLRERSEMGLYLSKLRYFLLKMRCIYYIEPLRRTMEIEKEAFKDEQTYIIALQLNRIADTLERLLKISEMSL